MVANCANPRCKEPFRYFRSGKIFSLETEDLDPKCKINLPERRIEHFWVCGKCLSVLPLIQLTHREECTGQFSGVADPCVTLRLVLAFEMPRPRSQQIADWDA